MILAGTLCFLAVLAVDVYTDLRKKVNHKRGALLRSLGLVPSTIFLSLGYGDFWWGLFLSIVMQFFVFWLLFDGLYNTFRKFGWFFQGSDDKDDAVLDEIPKWLSIGFKIVGSAASILFYAKVI